MNGETLICCCCCYCCCFLLLLLLYRFVSTHFSLNVITDCYISCRILDPTCGWSDSGYLQSDSHYNIPLECVQVSVTLEKRTATSTSIVIDGLEENSIYTVTISAMNNEFNFMKRHIWTNYHYTRSRYVHMYEILSRDFHLGRT